VYFEIILKLLTHLDPHKPIFINGFPTCKSFLEQPEFQNVVTFTEHGNFWTGTIGGYEFIGLPFLNRPKGGKDTLVTAIHKFISQDPFPKE
jgi:hypothetical protein